MQKSLALFLMLACATSSAFASDVTQKVGHKTLLKTSRSAQCSTPSGKASRECTQTASTQVPHARH